MQSASSLKSHKKQKHDPKICRDCGVDVKGKKALRNHRRKHVTIPCQICSKDVAKSNMNNHLKSCQGKKNKDPKVYVCDKCEYKTTDSCNLKKTL